MWSHKKPKLVKRILEWFINKAIVHPFYTIFYFVILISLIYLVTLIDNKWNLKILNLLSLPPNGESTIHLINFIGVIGALGTAVGFLYTYHQLKLSNDRIDSYDQLYDWIERFLKESVKKKAKKFLFYGSTILPGNISLDDESKINDYMDEIDAIFRRSNNYEKIENIKLVVPKLQDYEEIYKWFYDKDINTLQKRYKNNTFEWVAFVNEKKNQAIEFQKLFCENDKYMKRIVFFSVKSR